MVTRTRLNITFIRTLLVLFTLGLLKYAKVRYAFFRHFINP